jgi:OFA family oxalate/formate antiporter-like MFS transporter
MNVNNRWVQLTAALIAMIMIANLQYSWTLFVTPIQRASGWKLSDIQWAFTLFILFQTWVQPAQGWLIDRLGPRLFVSAAAVLCGVGWGGLGMATSLTSLYTLYIVAGIGAALVYGGCMGLALKWFSDRRGLAAGIIAAGFGGGTFLFMPFIAMTIRTAGYQRAFLETGAFQGLLILIAAQFLRHPAALRQIPNAGAKRGPESARERGEFTTREMLGTPVFYVMYAMFVTMATGGLLVTANAGPMAQSWGISVSALTLATSLNPLANGASRVFWGWASDRIGRERILASVFVMQAASLILVLMVGRLSGAWFTATLVLTFFTWGEIFSLFPSLVGDYFGARHATSNYGVLYSAKGVASIIAGGVAALLYERFGTWSAELYGSAALALVAAGLALILPAVLVSQRKVVGMPAKEAPAS